jgi:hypothetical protein
MKLFYRNVTKRVTLPFLNEFLRNFGKLTLEQTGSCANIIEQPLFCAVLRDVMCACDREVRSVTMGLCNSFRYKCDVTIISEKCGDAPCLTL